MCFEKARESPLTSELLLAISKVHHMLDNSTIDIEKCEELKQQMTYSVSVVQESKQNEGMLKRFYKVLKIKDHQDHAEYIMCNVSEKLVQCIFCGGRLFFKEE